MRKRCREAATLPVLTERKGRKDDWHGLLLPSHCAEVWCGSFLGELSLGKSVPTDVFDLIKTVIKGTQNRTDLHFMAFKATFVRVHRSDDSNPYLFN